ncbi:hypothetical protein HF086_005784 [Spodoptera exigua]|uniref:Uncharacterized protein n=1 Tax=Spodoptera exigua TaxID=7107 RepID=A0A922M0Y0_SPOEX|nr:hypothetical protein HF086_005784 [Spodoptera exigua]
MKLILDEWKIVVYYDVKPYWHGTAVFNKFHDHLENICSTLKQKTQCEIIALELRHAFAELEHYNQMLLNPQGRVNMRSKRGLINGVGSIARTLFGVLDDQFAEQYQRDIELIKQNEKHLALLSKNQTSIIEAEYNILRRSEETIEKQYKLFNQHLINLDKITNNLRQEIESQELSIEFLMSAISANSFIEHLRNVQEILLDTVTNIYNGKMNLHLIAPEQLKDELNVISSQLSKVWHSLSTTFKKIFLYHLLQVKAKMTESYLIIDIRMPLISREHYEVYNVIPVPKDKVKKWLPYCPLRKY